MTSEKTSTKRPFTQFNVRIPVLVKKVLEKAGEVNRRSQNEEAIYRLENFTEHSQMVAEMRKEMSILKSQQAQLIDKVDTLIQLIEAKSDKNK